MVPEQQPGINSLAALRQGSVEMPSLPYLQRRPPLGELCARRHVLPARRLQPLQTLGVRLAVSAVGQRGEALRVYVGWRVCAVDSGRSCYAPRTNVPDCDSRFICEFAEGSRHAAYKVCSDSKGRPASGLGGHLMLTSHSPHAWRVRQRPPYGPVRVSAWPYSMYGRSAPRPL